MRGFFVSAELGSVTMVMAAMIMAVPVMMVARAPNHSVDRTHRAADTCTDRTAHDTADRAGRTITAIRAFFGAADNALGMPGQRRSKQHQKCQGGSPCKGSMRRLDGGGDCFHFRLSC